MDSPAVYMVGRIEEVPRWSSATPMYEVPNVNGQNYTNANYNEWGAKPFNENRDRRRNTRGKPNHNRRNHQQAAWAAEPVAAAPPAWQAPPPAPAPLAPQPTGMSVLQDSEGPVAVNVQGLPYALCRQNCLEAMLDQAGLADEVMGCSLGEDSGKAVIYLASYDAAMKTVAHFGGRRWAHAGPPVTASVGEGQGPVSTAYPREAPARNRRPRGASDKQEPWSMGGGMAPPRQAAHGAGSYAPMLPIEHTFPQNFKGNDFSVLNSPSGELSPASKARWADFADEDDDKNEHASEENESTSAGSSGRASGDVAGDNPFACDTDDGF